MKLVAFLWVPRSEVLAMAEKTQQYMAGQINDRNWRYNPGIESYLVQLLANTSIHPLTAADYSAVFNSQVNTLSSYV